MIYLAYQTHADLMEPLRAAAGFTSRMLERPWPGMEGMAALRHLAAGCALLAGTRLTHRRPPFGIGTVRLQGGEVAVREEAACVTPFGTLLRFAKDGDLAQPKVLLVAPLSGHFATLLRETVKTLLPEHDVYITDWHNARDVPLSHGAFGFDEYVEHLIRFLEAMGPGAHVVAVCQPCVQALVATALLAEAGSPFQPRSLTLMAGPIDTRINPTEVNRLATTRSLGWFERNLIGHVPLRYPGAMRRVYPGFMQLTAFMNMNLGRHVKAHLDLYDDLVTGNREKAQAARAFYEEYFAVLDLPAEFYLETVRYVFQDHLLPRGRLEWRGRRVDPAAIRRTTLLTVEGEKDDICAVGQTLAAHELCTGLRPYRKRHHLQAGVGHYGVFSGRRWNAQIYPVLRHTILGSE